MATISDFLFGDFQEVRRQEIFDEQTAQLASDVGQPGAQAVSDQGIGPRRSRAPTGIFELPPNERAAEQARLTAAQPGFATQGVGLLNSALQNRAMMVETESRFLRDQQRRSEEFTTKDEREGTQWTEEHALRVVERNERAATHLQALLIGKDRLDFGRTSEARSIEAANQADAMAARIEPGEMQNIIGETNQLEKMQDNITTYKRGYAWNDLTNTGAWIAREALIRKPNKDQFDMNRLEFWRDIDSYQTYLLKEISGGAVTPEEYDRLTKLLPTAQMNDVEIDRNMRILHRELKQKLQLRAKAAVFEARQDPTAIFAAGSELPPSQFGAVELPEGARVINE